MTDIMENQATELQPRLKNDLAQTYQQPEYFTRIKHSVNLGDIIASLAAAKQFYDITKKKIIYAQKIHHKALYYPGASHPTVDNDGVNVCINESMFDMIKPLVESQEYIHSMEKYEGQHIDLDFDVIRSKTFVNLPHGMIQSWLFFAFPDLAYDLSKPWMFLSDEPQPVQEQTRGKIVLNFTERYRNEMTDYFFLKNYAPDLVFAGTEKEYLMFTNKWQLNIPRLEIKDFLEYAYAIKASRFFVGCQSFGWNLSEALKHPRLLEVCQYAVNCMPFIGENSYGFYHQVGVEHYFRILYNKTSRK
jgi:hypothetical protein